ncbi:origin recognition complex subunit 4 C-terminus-domain-containing protein [Clohesyomyces aquaticus]|uniref:Origin recognition complex subunit 4 n=1 Tax=Clohesyomyces aquaticus TaxID=1231657 RepID=A0A1Y1ZJI1_9PLEO|nr:origin recognition complex subunit 4 C-terminus-domain-containing protein [Clohesyomyces aquaticus]
MEETPRSSKRRKLDNQARAVSSPIGKGSTTRESGRLATRTTSLANGYALGKSVASPRRSQHPQGTPNGTTNGTPSRLGRDNGRDIYDDIDGALGEAPPAPTPSRTPRSRKKPAFDPSLPHPFKKNKTPIGTTSDAGVETSIHASPTPRRIKARVENGESASRQSFRSLVNGFKHASELEAEIQDELAAPPATPSKRKIAGRAVSASAKRSEPRVNGAAASPAARSSRASARNNEEHDESAQRHINGVNGTTSSKPRVTRVTASSRKAQKRAATETEDDELAAAMPSKSSAHRSTVQDSEDEIGDRPPPSGSKDSKTRRRNHRADHMDNQDDVIVLATPSRDYDNVGNSLEFDAGSVNGSILDVTEPSPFNIPSRKEPASIPTLPGHFEPGAGLELLKSIVMERITGKRPAPLVGLDEEYKTVHQTVENTITAGEGNSMLVIGARGSGKTALVNKVLSEISKDNSQDYHVVRLNGFIHTDDKIALREIWRQLGKEMDVEEDGGLSKNYADTLTTLLALLSHPSEQTGELTDQVAKAVIFIMDEFDLFAQHPRQTLLYNLFDIAQSRKAPIAVLGLTTRIDVANSLEKRVKSRFSHRYVHLSLAKTFTAFQEVCKANLLVQPEHLSVEEKAILGGESKNTPAKKGKKSVKKDILAEWNANVTTLFASPSFLTHHLAPYFYHTKSVSAVLTSFILTTAALSASSSTSLTPSHLLSPPDSKLDLLPSLSTLSLSLLIAAARLDIIHDSDSCNFNMCYDEYVILASKARIQSAAGGGTSSGSVSKVWGKEVARREWEGLVELGLLIPVLLGGGGGAGAGFAMVRCDVSLEEIGGVVQGEKAIDKGLERWCRQL